MSKHGIDFLTAQTRRLEALGIVLGAIATVVSGFSQQPLHLHPQRGRKRVYGSGYERLRAYRRRKSRMITK